MDSLPEAVMRQFEGGLAESLIELRRDLHQHPELSFQENRTATVLEQWLERLGPESLERVAGTGVVARIKGLEPGGVRVAIRGDIDALPIQEETGLAYSSENPGVMHACGHDVHATWAIGAAALLAKEPAIGEVMVVLQPAEELGTGAEAILASGVLDGVEAIFGGHVDRRFWVGEVVAQPGPLAAAADSFEIELRGVGAHGARPHLGYDPIVAAAAIVNSLQTVVARRLAPGTPGVITVGTLNAGTASNIVPETAHLTGTLRSTTTETRQLLVDELTHIAESIATAHRVKAKVIVHSGTPPILNDERSTEWAKRACSDLLGQDLVVPLPEVNMGGEDFAFYLEKIPGCFLRIGARERGGEVIGAHTPRFYAAEGSIFVGAAVLAESARRASLALAR